MNAFLNELLNISIAHHYQDRSFDDIIADLRERTGLHIIVKRKSSDPLTVSSYQATNMLSTLHSMAMAIHGTWGFKGRTIYIGHDLPDLDYEALYY